MTTVSLGLPLYTFNEKHYQFILEQETVQPYLNGMDIQKLDAVTDFRSF